MAKLFLKKNEDLRIKSGHLWVFSNEVKEIEGTVENGDIVEVYSGKTICEERSDEAIPAMKADFLGYGFYNKNSLITARLLGNSPLSKGELKGVVNYDGNFYEYASTRLADAFNLRKFFYPQRKSFRLVFSESDFLPGLIIDKYNDTYVLQIYSFGMQKNIQHIIDILKQDYYAENIFSMNELYFRKLEGLPDENEIYLGKISEEIIDDGKIKYKIDFTSGQKTGFYFDQCDNREFIENFAKGKSVLDAFCYSGGFGMHAAYAGASSVTFVDSSDNSVRQAERNFTLNNLDCEAKFISQDVFDYLENPFPWGRDMRRGLFDVIILDPPAFAKSKKSLPSAIKGYIKLNKLALQLISRGGFLAASSCSHHLKENDFLEAVNKSAVKAKRTIQLLYFHGASLDHPRLPAMEETSYLKFAVFKVT